MQVQMEKSWAKILKEEFNKEYMKDLQKFLIKENKSFEIYPMKEQIFHAFCQIPFDEVKVVIMGQDPYHGKGQAHGLSFSVPCGIKPPPSLQNIYKELIEDVKIKPPTTGCLYSWAKQGVLLLNATLTVRANEPRSHYGKGWEEFTDKVIEKLIQRQDPLVFLLWGKSAQEKCLRVIENQNKKNHLILCASHPSPYSACSGFFGCKHFSKTNHFLKKLGKFPINWQIA